MIGSPPPFLIYLLGALVTGLLPQGLLRRVWMLAVPVASGTLLLAVQQQAVSAASWEVTFLGMQLDLYRVTPLGLVFGIVFHIATFLGVLYSMHVEDRIQHVASLAYAGCALGVVFAGDLFTVFVFWEGMAVTSVFLIWARRTERARRAGMRYLLQQLVSGLLLFAGILMHLHDGGSLEVSRLLDPATGERSAGFWVMLVGVGIKAAFPGLHTWLTDAYPEATPTGTVWLSAFTTKTAIYLLAACFPGTKCLVLIGAVMTAFPIFYAVIENDLRRVLAYSMINQLGFMVVGVGIGTGLAVNGAAAHAFNDILFKGLLFMAMGAVLQQTGRIGGAELGGLYKTMPVTCILCIVGACSISAFPLFSGFVSKSLVVSETAHAGMIGVWLVLLFASAGVFHHAGIKIPYFAFFAHDRGIRTTEPPRNMILAMAMAAGLCIFNGTIPRFLYGILPFPMEEYAPYTSTHVLLQLQILFWSALAFAFLMKSGLYPPEIPSHNLDADWFLRKGARAFLWVIRRPLLGLSAGLGRIPEQRVPTTLARMTSPITPPGSLPAAAAVREPYPEASPEEAAVTEEIGTVPIGLAVGLVVISLIVLLLLYVL
jgi:multicomponent Na+:H+ antiporter subunit D